MPDNGLFYRSFEIDLRALDEEKREVTLSFSSEEEISRWEIIEVLDHSAGAVDLRRLKKMGAYLFNHNPDRIIGPVFEAKIENGRGIARVGYDDTEEGSLALARTKSGSLKGISVGYRVQKYRLLGDGEEYQLATKKITGRKNVDIYVATKWMPIEISSTPIPADSSVGVNRDFFERSIEAGGIEIEGLTGRRVFPNNLEDFDMTRDETRALILEMVPEIAAQLRGALGGGVSLSGQTEVGSQDQQRAVVNGFSLEERDLIQRATAVSSFCVGEIMDMILAGRSVEECSRKIHEICIAGCDAKDSGAFPGDDGTRRLPANSTPAGPGRVSNFKQLTDEEFFRAIANPLLLS